MTATLGLFPENEQQKSTISLAALCSEVATSLRKRGGFDKALEYILREHNVATAETREVLACEIYADIRRERRPAQLIPHSSENLIEYARILLHYRVPFAEAVDRTCKQYHIEAFSAESSDFIRRASSILNLRSQKVQKKLATNPAFANIFRTL